MPWVISTAAGRRFTGPLGDVLVPLNVPTEVPQWVYDIITLDEFGVTVWVPGQPITVAAVFDPTPKCPAPLWPQTPFTTEGGEPLYDAYGGLPV